MIGVGWSDVVFLGEEMSCLAGRHGFQTVEKIVFNDAAVQRVLEKKSAADSTEMNIFFNRVLTLR